MHIKPIFLLLTAATLSLTSVAALVDSSLSLDDEAFAAEWFENAANGTLVERVNPAVYWNAYPAAGCSGAFSTLQTGSGVCTRLPGSGSLKIVGWASGCTGSNHKSEF